MKSTAPNARCCAAWSPRCWSRSRSTRSHCRLLPSLFPSAMIAERYRQTECAAPHVASTFAYQEPSLVFLLGTETRFTDGAGAADFLRGGTAAISR